MSNNLIQDSIADARVVTSVVEDRAKNMFAKEFSPKIKHMLQTVINEEVSTGSDQPGGYSPETDKDAIVGGSNINKNTGDGPVVGYPAASDVKEGEEFDFDDNEEKPEDAVAEGDASTVADDDSSLDAEVYEGDDAIPGLDDDDEEEVIEVVSDTDDLPGATGDEEEVLEGEGEIPPVEDDEEDMPAGLAEARKQNKKLVRENKILRNAVSTLRKKFEQVDLFNAKLAYAYHLITQPGLTRGEKKRIAEAFDGARTVREAKLIAKTIKQSFANRPTTSATRPARNTNVKSVISEQTRSTGSTAGHSRLEELAGL